MLRFVAALLFGEALLLTGVVFTPVLGWPIACIVAGLQVVPVALLSEHQKPKRGAR